MTRIARRLLESKRLPCLAALVAVALVSPSLGSGWFLDDLWHRAGLTKAEELSAYLGTSGDFRGPMRMYSFWDGDRDRTRRLMNLGIIPWWSDPSVRISFWRPLAALTHLLDYRLWPEHPLWMHVQSALWLALLAGLAGLAHRRFIETAWVAGLATVIFAVSDSHALPAAWLANRHALVGACLGVLALLAHARWRAARERSWALLAWLAFALALLASEAGVVVLAYVCAHAAVLDGGSWRSRLQSLAPYAVILAIWRVTYTSLGYGVAGSAVYVDPGADLPRFLRAVLERAPTLGISLLGIPAADASLLLSPAAGWLLAGGAGLVLALLAWLTRPLWTGCRSCRFFALATSLAIVPLCTAMPGSRNLGLAAFASAGFVAQLGANVRARGLVGFRARVAHVAALAVLGACLVLAPLSLVASATLVARLGPGIERVVDVAAADRGGARRELILVNPPCSLGVFFLVPDRLLKGLRPSDRTRVLAPGTGSVEIVRLSQRELIVRPQGGYCLPPGAARSGAAGPFVSLDNVLRRADAFLCGERGKLQLGSVVALTGVRVRVTALTKDGRAGEACFEFDSTLEDPQRAWLRWNAARGAYEPWTPPAVGGRVSLE